MANSTFEIDTDNITAMTNNILLAGALLASSIDDLQLWLEEVEFETLNSCEVKDTGFESYKYKAGISVTEINIILRGDSPVYVIEKLKHMASSINGNGCPVKFTDRHITGTDVSPKIYNARWINAGDFVESSELLAGATIKLQAYLLPQDRSGS